MVHLQTLLRSSSGAFVQVEACEERPANPQYVEGAIELTIDGSPILTLAEWDYVDQLWSYIADMIQTFLRTGEASTYFPDQPILLTFARSSPGRLLVSSEIGGETRRSNVGEGEFLKALRTAGDAFFEKMMKLLPENSEGYGIARRSLLR